MRYPKLLLPVLLLAPASGGQAQQLTPTQLVGCYDVAVGPWLPPLELGEDSLEIEPPNRVVLDTMPTRTPFSESRSLTVAPNALPSVHGLTGWRLEGDTVVVSWSTGYAGLRARLLPADGLLIGEAESFWDYSRERQRRRLTLSPVACDAPLTITESDQKFVPRSLRLSNGTELTLLDPYNPNERWERRPGKRSRWIYGESIDRVGPTEEIRISPDRQGRLQVIVARLHSDADFVALVERLAAWLGPPSGTATHSWAEVESESVGWRNRTTSLSLMRSRRIGEEWHVTVLLSERRRRF